MDPDLQFPPAQQSPGVRWLVRLRQIWLAIKKPLTSFPKWFAVYLGIVGLFSFNCFILEEAFQTVMFSTWQAFDAREYRLVKRSLATMEKARTTLVIVNNVGNWLNPFGWVAYNAYADAEQEYIDAVRAKLFANAPELFDGETITFTFRPQESEPADRGMAYRNGQIIVLAMKEPSIVTGKVMTKNGNVIVDMR
jgi:hypothetical protein